MSRLRRFAILILLMSLTTLLLIVGGQFAVERSGRSGVITVALSSQPTFPIATPLVPFSPLDPAIIPALQRGAGEKPLVVLPDIPPVGMYLPAKPLRPLLASQTPIPTETPLPPSPTATFRIITATPGPTDTPSQTPTITPTPTITLTATITASPGPSPTYFPTPTVLATRTPIADLGIIDPNNLPTAQAVAGIGLMTPNPGEIGVDCAPTGLPVEGVLTQAFSRWHSGIDLGVPIGTLVKATQSGQVIFAGWSDIGYGWLVIIQNGPYITYYAHNSFLNVIQYQYVRVGDILSYSGSTGHSTGPHVHYETRINDIPVDPLTFDARRLPTC